MLAVWSYFTVSQTDITQAICNKYQGKVARGGACVKSFNITNLIKYLEKEHKKEHVEFRQWRSEKPKTQKSVDILIYPGQLLSGNN